MKYILKFRIQEKKWKKFVIICFCLTRSSKLTAAECGRPIFAICNWRLKHLKWKKWYCKHTSASPPNTALFALLLCKLDKVVILAILSSQQLQWARNNLITSHFHIYNNCSIIIKKVKIICHSGSTKRTVQDAYLTNLSNLQRDLTALKSSKSLSSLSVSTAAILCCRSLGPFSVSKRLQVEVRRTWVYSILSISKMVDYFEQQRYTEGLDKILIKTRGKMRWVWREMLTYKPKQCNALTVYFTQREQFI